ncbi:MAG: hypothetical protein ABW091_04870 [Microbacterium sp.]
MQPAIFHPKELQMHFARRRTVLAIAGAGVALAALIILGVFGLLREPTPATGPESPAQMASASVPSQRADKPRPVLVTAHAEPFARSVARALFNWDTRHEGGPSPWAQMLVDVADPEEAAALASDIRGYLPATEMWEQLATYGTRQRLEVHSVVVPEAWRTALKQAAPEQIPTGSVALTVAGTADREGTWRSEVVRTERLVVFTVFVRCPDVEPCTLLRLSQLDKPLK